ncbi:hypothetical protein, partial [Streptomyces sp. NPDC006334]|uniref:hypothetical protein n=1 Tax=Streptomyces sp. NPDC006334 TaxID=3156754 RepID=UPI0033B92900
DLATAPLWRFELLDAGARELICPHRSLRGRPLDAAESFEGVLPESPRCRRVGGRLEQLSARILA